MGILRVVELAARMGGAPVAAASDDGALAWHEDRDAGVRFPLPFAGAHGRTGAQVLGLLASTGEVRVPDGVRFTSGAVAREGTPFVLVWVRREPAPTIEQLEWLAMATPEEFRERYGLSDWTYDAMNHRGSGAVARLGASRDGLKAQVLVQFVQGGSIHVGYYYRDDGDAARFGRLKAGFEVTSAGPIRLGGLHSSWSPHAFLAGRSMGAWALGASTVGALVVLGLLLRVRRQQRTAIRL